MMDGMTEFDEVRDFVVVGSGGGSMCAGLVMRAAGKSVLILEKTALVGGTTPTKLATIIQIDPIHVTFTISEQDVQRIRAAMAAKGLTAADLGKIPVEVGLQTEQGYPHAGSIDYIAPQIDPSTGTLLARGIFENANRTLLPGFFTRVRVPTEKQPNALLVPDTALGADQGGRYLLVVDKDNVVVQRHVDTGPLVGTMRVIDKGVAADDRVVVDGIQRAIPGDKVDPTVQTAAAAPAAVAAPGAAPGAATPAPAKN